ncbi:hypothetical protein [Gemmata sp.]|uniref:hypothetical protein n=1 Tax=Gemmata sp. TaxID=1914242 RepID=UPI003F71E499
MATDEVIPHVGIMSLGGLVRLGMTRDEVQPLLERDHDIQVDFCGSPPAVAFIQSPKHWGSLEGIDLFESAADDVVAEIAHRFGFDPTVYRPGRHTYYFPALNMILWRSCTSETDGEQGYVFDCVSLHAPGYHNTQTVASLRERTGLPPIGPGS